MKFDAYLDRGWNAFEKVMDKITPYILTLVVLFIVGQVVRFFWR